MTPTLHRRAQLTAVAELRWRMFLNSLRSKRGKMELLSRIIVTTAFALGGLGAFAAAVGMSWYCVSQGKPERLAFPLWGFFFFWQVFPVMSTAFTSNPDSSDLLRFPLNYSSYFLIRLAYGFFDPASAIGCVGVFGVLLGVSFARPALFPWALLALLTFALFNLVLMQTVFAWLERWLAQRRTREILGVLFILTMLSFQLIGPMMERLGKGSRPQLGRAAEIVTQVQAVLPACLAANAIALPSHSQFTSGLISLCGLAVMTAAVGLLLNLRLRAQFRGENLSEAAASRTVAQVQGKAQSLQMGWNLSGFSQPVAAVFEKEIRYIARSGPMLLTLIMPIFMLVVFRMNPANPMRMRGQSSFLSHTPELAFPAAAAYAMLVLTNLLYNSFGGDAAGVQFFYACPVSFRHILLEKISPTPAFCLPTPFGRGSPSPTSGPAILDGHYRDYGRPAVRRSAEFHRRNSALDLFAQEARLLHLRPSKRIANYGAGEPGTSDRNRRNWRRRLSHRQTLQQSVDRDFNLPGIGSDLNSALPAGLAPHRWHCAAAPRNAAGRIVSGLKPSISSPASPRSGIPLLGP